MEIFYLRPNSTPYGVSFSAGQDSGLGTGFSGFGSLVSGQLGVLPWSLSNQRLWFHGTEKAFAYSGRGKSGAGDSDDPALPARSEI